VKTDINTLLTALYVKIDDWLGRPRRVGRPPKLSDAARGTALGLRTGACRSHMFGDAASWARRSEDVTRDKTDENDAVLDPDLGAGLVAEGLHGAEPVGLRPGPRARTARSSRTRSRHAGSGRSTRCHLVAVHAWNSQRDRREHAVDAFGSASR
jgi:hypothetical protein